jgi:hypothetical protein
MNANHMKHEDAHISSEELLMAADGELTAGRDADVRNHLSACGLCRARMDEIEGTLAELIHGRNLELDSKLPPIAGSRAILRARLAVRPPVLRWSPRWAVAAAAIGITVLVAYQWTAPMADLEPGIAPKTSLTPGATLALTVNDVCAEGFAQSVPVIPASIARKVFEAYGIANPRRDAYEVDYLITPELGGATSIRNLWPEPYHAPVWNAHVKDELENRLHRMVCNGELDLVTAQREIAADWIAAYKKYFHSDRPVMGGCGKQSSRWPGFNYVRASTLSGFKESHSKS